MDTGTSSYKRKRSGEHQESITWGTLTDGVGHDGDCVIQLKCAQRVCWQCGRDDCKGNGTGGSCSNPCQDCGCMREVGDEGRCPGRNSQQRKKKCPIIEGRLADPGRDE
jgi:hypothetical protein